MIARASDLPAVFDPPAIPAAPIPEAAVEAVASLLLDVVEPEPTAEAGEDSDA